MTDNEILNYAIENGMLDLSHIQEQIEMNDRKELLEKHPYSIWKNESGKWFTYLPDPNVKRKVKKRNTRKEIEDVIVDYWKSQIDSPTIENVFKEWNDLRLESGSIKASTYTRYQQVFDRHFETFGKRKIKSVTEYEFAEFLEEQISTYQLNAKAFRNLKCITRGIIKKAKRKQLISYTADVVMQEVDTSEKKYKSSVKSDAEEVFTPDEMSKIIKYLSEHKDIWNLGLLILCVTGLRVGELCALNWEDVTKESIFVHRTETRYKTKDGKWIYEVSDSPKTDAGIRTAVIPQGYQWIIPEIRKLHDNEEYVFFRDGKRMRTTCMRKRFQRILIKLNIPARGIHKIRKTYCSLLFLNGLDGRQIISQMGHTDIECSEKYYHRNLVSIEDTLNAVSNIPEFKPKLKLIC